MKLLLDIGNTRTKAVLSDGSGLVPVEYSLSLIDQLPIKQISYASVKDAKNIHPLIELAKTKNIRLTEVKTQAKAFGVTCAYQQFQTLGIDRWLAVLGAVSDYSDKDVIIVDAGTATTVDFVTKDKEHIGGWIIPGLELMTSSIAQRADKVFDDMNTEYRYDVGKATPEALKFGCLAAQIGIVHQAFDFFSPTAQLVICGGNGPLILKSLTQFNPHYDELIVFKGLSLF